MSTLRRRVCCGSWLTVTLLTSGCSFIFSHAPPEGYETMPSFTCTESHTAPILDIVWGSLNLLGALAIAGDPDNYEYNTGYSASTGVTVGLSWAALSSFSAAAGFKKAKKCREAKAELARRQPPPGQPDASAGALIRAVIIAPAVDTLAVGQMRQLVATARTSSGSIAPDRQYAWSSSNDAIASVSNAGLVTAHAVGSVTIAANTGNIVGTASIVVASPR
jgi:hypothetical protein